MPTTKGAGSRIPLKIGNSSTYVNIDTTNNIVEVYVAGVKVHEWS